MPIVAIYRFDAKFLLVPERQTSSGQDRIAYEGLLLLRQFTPARSDEAAIAALTDTYRGTDCAIFEYGVLDERTLDMPEVLQYAPLYHAAMESGSAMSVSDPSAYDQVPSATPQTGFRPALR